MGRVTDHLHTLGPGRELTPPPFIMEPMSALGQRNGALAVQSPTHGDSHKTDPATIWSILVLSRPPFSCQLTHIWDPGSPRAVVIHHLQFPGRQGASA